MKLGGLQTVVLFCVLLVALGACSKKKKSLASIQHSYSRNDFAETIVQCEHAIRNNIRSSEVYYYYGLSLLELGRDYESFRQFQEAVSLDSTTSPRIAARLVEKGREAIGGGESRRAADRLKRAAELDRGVRLGEFDFLVADAYFKDRSYSQAARFYASAVANYPDTAAAEQAFFNMSECHVALGDSAAAIEALERQVESFTRGALSSRARWKLVNLLYGRAGSEFARGNYETVVEQVNELLGRTENLTLIQRARFLLGEAYERLGEYREAYNQYKAIIQEDRGASGRVVQRARAKIDAFRDSGLI
jgi:tetratricopeptide (TPR) repeat protein